MKSLSKTHLEILDHTVNRAAGGRYCGGGESIDELVDMGLMVYVGTPAWCPDKFYSITGKGRDALRAATEATTQEKGNTR